MKKVIEVTTMPNLGIAPLAGFYEYAGSLYAASSPGIMPMYVGIMNQLTQEASGGVQGGGVSENTLLKAIALVQRPELAFQLTSTP